MLKMAPPRPRCTAEEKQTLDDIVNRYKSMDGNKGTDVISPAAINKKWKSIADEFYALHPGCKRNSVQLYKTWESAHYRERRKSIEKNRQQAITGGEKEDSDCLIICEKLGLPQLIALQLPVVNKNEVVVQKKRRVETATHHVINGTAVIRASCPPMQPHKTACDSTTKIKPAAVKLEVNCGGKEPAKEKMDDKLYELRIRAAKAEIMTAETMLLNAREQLQHQRQLRAAHLKNIVINGNAL